MMKLVRRLCTACFTGTYPIELPEDGRIGKHILETLPISVRTGHDSSIDVESQDGHGGHDGRRSDADGVPIGVAGGAENALLHP